MIKISFDRFKPNINIEDSVEIRVAGVVHSFTVKRIEEQRITDEMNDVSGMTILHVE